MAIAIPDEFKTAMSRGVAIGRCRTEEEAFCEGPNLLRDREQKLKALKALRADNRVGLDQRDAGESGILDIEDIKRRGRQRLASTKSPE